MKRFLTIISEFAAALFILGAAFWGPWLYWFLTGAILEF